MSGCVSPRGLRVAGIADDTDDLESLRLCHLRRHRALKTRPAARVTRPANRILAEEHAADERLVDDADSWRLLAEICGCRSRGR